jgi:uncharacterized protein (DUF433 family)
MTNEYIEQHEGEFRIIGTRVSLDSVVYAFLRGESPEGIVDSFPALNMEQVFGALAYYVRHRDAVDRYLENGHREFEVLREHAQRDHPAFYAKLTEARQRTHAPGA